MAKRSMRDPMMAQSKESVVAAYHAVKRELDVHRAYLQIVTRRDAWDARASVCLANYDKAAGLGEIIEAYAYGVDRTDGGIVLIVSDVPQSDGTVDKYAIVEMLEQWLARIGDHRSLAERTLMERLRVAVNKILRDHAQDLRVAKRYGNVDVSGADDGCGHVSSDADGGL